MGIFQLFSLAVSAVVGDVALQVDLEVAAERLHAVVAHQRDDGIDREHGIGSEQEERI